MDDLAQILRFRLGSRQAGFQQLTRLLLHGASVAGGADTEPPLGVFREFSNGNAGHAINDIIDGIDCKEDLGCSRSANPLAPSGIELFGKLQRPALASLSGEGLGRDAAVEFSEI